MDNELTAADVDRRNAEVDAAWAAHLASQPASPAARLTRRNWLLQRYEEQNGLCAYCGDIMVVMTGDEFHARPDLRANRATRDHVTPRALGGPDDLENIVAACWDCNCIKGNIPPRVFVLWILNAPLTRRVDPPALREYLRLEANAFRARASAGMDTTP